MSPAPKILVTGSLTARPDTFDQLLALSRQHVARSRLEAGCIAHAVHRDVEDPMRLVFAEEWASREALEAHFAASGTRAFVAALSPLVAEPPVLKVYRATAVDLP